MLQVAVAWTGDRKKRVAFEKNPKHAKTRGGYLLHRYLENFGDVLKWIPSRRHGFQYPVYPTMISMWIDTPSRNSARERPQEKTGKDAEVQLRVEKMAFVCPWGKPQPCVGQSKFNLKTSTGERCARNLGVVWSLQAWRKVLGLYGLGMAQQYYLSTNLGGSKLKHCNTNGAAFPRILRVSVVRCLLTVGSEAW